MNLKNKILELRKLKNMSQEKLALELNVSRQAVAKWENGESYPDIDNLIQLSNLFNISIDRLIKDNNCIETIINKNYDSNVLVDFLILAKKKTYAGNGQEQEISSRPKSHDLIFENDDYKYIDTYLGGERFIGEEAVFKNNIPVWAMNYSGIEINEKFSGSFLKEALSNVPNDRPFRGPEIFKDGDYLYICKINGDFFRFEGKEEIYMQDEKVYECVFHGGIIK